MALHALRRVWPLSAVLKRTIGLLLLTSAGLAIIMAFRRQAAPVTPTSETVFTSTRYITCLAVAPQGELWAGTMGGILHRTRVGTWEKFTRSSGLPSHEVRSLKIMEGEIVAAFPTSLCRRSGGRWIAMSPQPGEDSRSNVPVTFCSAAWNGSMYASDPTGLSASIGSTRMAVPLPASAGSHISALTPHGNTLWAAVYGDGVWEFDGKNWRPVDLRLPREALGITAMAVARNTVWIGTRNEGLWECTANRSPIQHLMPCEPIDDNCQALAMFGGNLFVSTLDEGLAVRTDHGWGHFSTPQISSNAPRQMQAFQGTLFLRHGSGKVDRWNGRRWDRNICAALPRRQVSALAADSERLYAAQWGGWSEFDGKTWTHFLTFPELQGLAVTALLPQTGRLWIGTQSRGIAEFDRNTRRIAWHDERCGVPDDWITALGCDRRGIAAGTFVGGLAVQSGAKWNASPELRGENVTAIEPDGSGGIYVATRTGVRRFRRGAEQSPAGLQSRLLSAEAQCLCPVAGGLWIGTRTGLFFYPDSRLRRE